MTGRFFRGPISWSAYRECLDIRPPDGIEPPEPRYNIPPMSWVPIIRPREFHQPGYEVVLKLWTLVPTWWNKPLSEKKWASFTARSETIDEAPTFRGAFRYRRCLIPASGFFGWAGAQGKKTPSAIGLVDTSWLCFAGVWERWGHDGGEIDTFAMLTTEANDIVGAYSTRMPVIIRPRDYTTWLDPAYKKVDRMFMPFPAEEMEEWAVSDAVGNVHNQGPDLIAR